MKQSRKKHRGKPLKPLTAFHAKKPLATFNSPETRQARLHAPRSSTPRGHPRRSTKRKAMTGLGGRAQAPSSTQLLDNKVAHSGPLAHAVGHHLKGESWRTSCKKAGINRHTARRTLQKQGYWPIRTQLLDNKVAHKVAQHQRVKEMGQRRASKDSVPYVRKHDLFYLSTLVNVPEHFRVKLNKNNFVIEPKRHYNLLVKNMGRIKACFSPKSCWFVFTEPVKASTRQEAHAQAIKELVYAKATLEETFPGLVLGEPQEEYRLSRRHIGHVNDPVAKQFIDNGKRYMDDRLVIDDSEGPELETVHPVKGREDFDAIIQDLYHPVMDGEFKPRELVKGFSRLEEQAQKRDHDFEKLIRINLSTSELLNSLVKFIVPQDSKPRPEAGERPGYG